MVKNPFFSLIIPALDEERYLPLLLQSIAKQSWQNFEVILVDANSKDKTQDIFRSYAKQFLQSYLIVSNAKNVDYQRNLGAKKANGSYFVFLDADVELPDDFLKKVHGVIHTRKAKLLTTWMSTAPLSLTNRIYMLIANCLLEAVGRTAKPYAGGYDAIVDREVFQKVEGYREDCAVSSDHDFATRAVASGVALVILKHPQIIYSLRRIERLGIKKIVSDFIKVNYHYFRKGPYKKGEFEYPLGGNNYKN